MNHCWSKNPTMKMEKRQQTHIVGWNFYVLYIENKIWHVFCRWGFLILYTVSKNGLKLVNRGDFVLSCVSKWNHKSQYICRCQKICIETFDWTVRVKRRLIGLQETAWVKPLPIGLQGPCLHLQLSWCGVANRLADWATVSPLTRVPT